MYWLCSYKIKCVGTPTCVRCEKSGVVCQFDFVANTATPGPTDLTHQHPTTTEPLPEIPLQNSNEENIPAVFPAESLPTPVPMPDQPVQREIPQSDSDIMRIDFNTIDPQLDYDSIRRTPAFDWDLFNLQPPSHLSLNSPFVGDFSDLDALIMMNDKSPSWEMASLVGLSEPSVDEPAQMTPPQEIFNDSILSTTTLPWVADQSSLDEMYKNIELVTECGWLREVPKISSTTAREYWDLYHHNFHPVRNIVFGNFMTFQANSINSHSRHSILVPPSLTIVILSSYAPSLPLGPVTEPTLRPTTSP